MVESLSWLAGLPQAMGELGLDTSDLPRVMAQSEQSGVVRLADPTGRIRLRARSWPSASALPAWATSDAAMPPDAWPDATVDSDDARVAVLVDGEQPLPPMPDGLNEILFDATARIAEATTREQAAESALTILRSLVPHEAGSVFYGGVDAARFTFLASHGPKAAQLAGMELPFGEGVVGHVHDTGVAVLIHDLAHSARHLRSVDLTTGYWPRALVAAPMRTDDGRSLGVIELLDQEDRFEPWHLDVLEEVGRALAERLATDEAAA